LITCPVGFLVPAAIEEFRGDTELDDEGFAVVCLAALLSPQPQKRLPIIAHNNPGIGAADECATMEF
jgi:hypothetical protein